MRHSLAGVLLMLGGVFLLSAMDALVKWIVERDISPIQIIAIRSVIIVPAMLIGFAIAGRLNELAMVRRDWHIARGLIGFAAPFCFFLGLRYLPLSDSVVIAFSATFFIVILSVLLLKEQVGRHRWAAVALGYLGVVIAMSPEGGGDWLGYFLVLVAALTYAFLFVTGSYMTRTETVSSLVMSFNTCAGTLGLVLLPWFWVPIDLAELGAIAGVAVLALAGHFLLTMAFSRAEASMIAPFEYSALLWAVLFDLAVWGRLPGGTTWLGAALIIASGLYVVYRERRRSGSAPPA